MNGAELGKRTLGVVEAEPAVLVGVDGLESREGHGAAEKRHEEEDCRPGRGGDEVLHTRATYLYSAARGGFARHARSPSRLHEDDEGDGGGDDEDPRDPQVTMEPATLAERVTSIRGQPVVAKDQDRPSVASAVIWTSGGTPVRVKRTTSPTWARSSSFGSFTLKPMVMPAGMKPAISSWVSTTT